MVVPHLIKQILCALPANDIALYIFRRIFQKEICTPVLVVKRLKRQREGRTLQGGHLLVSTGVLPKRFDRFINKLHGLLSLSFFF